MTIAVIGAGAVGRALAAGFTAAGREVVFGVRSVDDPRHADLARRFGLAEAAHGADLVVLAVPAAAVADTIPALGLRPGQIVVDATNAVSHAVPGGHPTMASHVASLVPDGVVMVKAFNTIGAEHLSGQSHGADRAFLPIAGEAAAADTVRDLAEAMGFEAVVVGGLDLADLVEAHARLWIRLAFGCGWGRGFAFGVLGR